MEEIAKQITNNVGHAVEIISACIIAFALLRLLFYFIEAIFVKAAASKLPLQARLEGLRIQFGSSIAVSLELLLGADVLATAVAPSWDDIGKLAAIAVLRTALNYFLERELKHINTAYR